MTRVFCRIQISFNWENCLKFCYLDSMSNRLSTHKFATCFLGKKAMIINLTLDYFTSSSTLEDSMMRDPNETISNTNHADMRAISQSELCSHDTYRKKFGCMPWAYATPCGMGFYRKSRFIPNRVPRFIWEHLINLLLA